MVSLRPVDISPSQLYGRVAARSGNASAVEPQELDEASPSIDENTAQTIAGEDGVVSEQELTTFIQGQNAPVVFQYTDEAGVAHTYQVTVNAEGQATIEEVVEEEEAEESQTTEDLAPTSTSAPASAENGSDETRAIIEQVLASLRAAKANIRKQIEEIERQNQEEQAELEKIEARRAAQRKLEQAEAAMTQLEARLNALINVSPQQRALVLAKLQALSEAVKTLETLSAGLAEGTVTPEQIEEQSQIIDGLTTEIENKLDEEEVKILTQIFGEDLSTYVRDPKKALDDGVINADELTNIGKAVLRRYLSAQVTFGELQTLAEKGLPNSQLKFALLLGLEEISDASEKAYDELLTAARAGELDYDRWNEIMEENGFKAFTVNSDSFAALFLGEHDSIFTDETVSGTINLDRAMQRIHMTMVAMGGPDRLADTFMTYAGNKNFFFIDFQRQGRVFLEALGALGLDQTVSVKERMEWIMAQTEDGLKEIIDQLYGRRGKVELPEEILSEAQKRFRAMSAGEKWDTVVSLLLNRVFSSIQVPREGLTDREIFEEESHIFEDILTEVQDIPAEDLEDVLRNPENLRERAPILDAYIHEVQWTIIFKESQTINYEAILDGRIIDHPDPAILDSPEDQATVPIPVETSQTVTEVR